MATFADIANDIDEIVFEAFTAGAYQANSLMKERIFDKHLTVDGTPFGKYNSEAYKEYRKDLGKQVGSKDLQVTLNLKDSVEAVDNTVIFSNEEDAKKGRGQETNYDKNGIFRNQIGKPIFDLSEEEKTDSIRVIDEKFTELLKLKLDGITITI